ncbi:serine/threonine-protein phosphatase CPPED1-like isoform X2 [Adelges cooleyi]|uniref:serine/threonine-protein phosphatase CPPED1-like isoform X2 n=1 Tax=Adelges cooleyi TaxID=133065 RepID=UPI0021803E5A|nr:serine/threonine-protein phosphatase CPPED1-like isoform X2 [Adelges cooleyi]
MRPKYFTRLVWESTVLWSLTVVWPKRRVRDNQNWSSSYCFVVGSDPQFGYCTDCKPRPPTCWHQEMNRSMKAVEKINALRPRPQFVVICGDLVHAMPSKDEKTNKLQVQDFKKVYDKLHRSISLVCVCGNHDVGNEADEQSIDMYRDEFGQDYFSYWCGGVRFLVLNTQYYKKNTVQEKAKEQQQWLEGQLAKHKGQRIVVFQHIAWFALKIDEDETDYNLGKQLRMEMLEKFAKAGVTHIFYGHIHRNHETSYKGMDMITTNAIGNPLGENPDPPGLRLVKVYENNLTHQYYSLEEFPCCVDLN